MSFFPTRNTLYGLAFTVFPFAYADSQENEESEEEAYYRFPREQRDLELKEIASNLRFGYQIGASAYRQKQSGIKEKDSSIEGLDLEFLYEAGGQIEFQVQINYEFDGGDRVIFEETFAKYEYLEEDSWYIEAGRMELPLGEYNSNFIEDPFTQVLGETYDGAFVLGYEKEDFEIALAGFKGDFEPRNVLVAINYLGFENVESGLYWSSNIGESLEFRAMQREALEEDDEGELLIRPVMGIGGFIALDIEPFVFDFEYVAALETFAAGLIDDDPRQPRSWNFEVAINPIERWQFAARIESTKYLPDSPKWQYGLAASYGLRENLIVTANYLRAEYREDPSKRNLFQIELIFEY